MIPNNWVPTKLKDIARVTDGAHFTPSYVSSGIPFLRVTDIQKDNIDLSKVKRIPLSEHKELIKRAGPERGDILLSKNGTIGITKVIDWDWEFSIFVSLCLIKPFDKKQVNTDFLCYLISSDFIQNQAKARSKSGTVTNLHLEEIREFSFFLPQLIEQNKIAEILSSVDSAIAKTQKVIDQTKKVKDGLLRELLTRGIGHTKFKKTEIGEIPEGWDVKLQGEVATFHNGRAYKLTEWEKTGTPVIRLQNLTGSGKEYYYSTMTLPDHQYCNRGDLLYMWSATFGPYFWQGDHAIYHYHIWKIEDNKDFMRKRFHYYLLDSVTARMKSQTNGSTMLHVTKGQMEKLLVPVPPLAEQDKIVKVLDKVMEIYESNCTNLKSLTRAKQGLLQDLLTGKVRVKV